MAFWERLHEILNREVVGEAMAKANDLANRSTPVYWKGASWKLALGLNPNQRTEFYDQLDERAEWMYEAVTTSEGMRFSSFLGSNFCPPFTHT